MEDERTVPIAQYIDIRDKLWRAEDEVRKANNELSKTKLELERLQGGVHDLSKEAYLRGVYIPPLMRSLQDSLTTVKAERDAALAEANQEKEIRRRVHKRFKRIRRDAAQGAYNLVEERLKVEKLEKQLEAEKKYAAGRETAALRQAALAYRILEAEDRENRGEEPSFP